MLLRAAWVLLGASACQCCCALLTHPSRSSVSPGLRRRGQQYGFAMSDDAGAGASEPSVLARAAVSLALCASIALGDVGGAVAALEPLPPPKSYTQQMVEAIPVKTIRGVWRIREALDKGGGGVRRGRLVFKGFVDEPSKGTLEYLSADGTLEGRGRWLLKPASITGGQILFSARWKVTYKGTGGEARLYRGDVVLDSAELMQAGGSPHPDAHIRGEVLQPVTTRTGSLSEKHIGEFQADLLATDKDEEKL